ncbi:MAG: hypothetical protein F4Z50_16010 [Gemmatimonadetes bacterium]|nr:hypothetical protein [Gemmatimonadota bacterium]MYD14477.1 hypothetical protein [Gemmatimonadota bacterium]
MRACRATAVAVAALALAAPPPASLAALQNRPGLRLENRMLRQASTHESRGELKEAEATLRELLEVQSGSVAAVLALERVLRADGRIAEALPVLDRYLAEYPRTSQVWQHKLGVLIEADSLAGVETTLENWIRAAPGSPDPYRLGARVLEGVHGVGRAAELIEEGVAALGDLPALVGELAEMQLARGDTAAALAAMRRITEWYPAGTPERRDAWIGELRLLVESPDTEAAMGLLAAFREEHPDAEQLDGLSAGLASRLLGQGKRDEAMAVLSGIEGPGAALERGYLLLEGGAVAEAVAALKVALPDLEPSHATEILELTLALSELTAPGATLAARAAIASHRGDPGHAVTLLRDGVDRLPAPDRPAILALGARLADQAGPAEDATAFRRRIVTEHADSREYPEAALRFARALSAEPGGRAEAVRVLEALIVARPDSPVVPGARRELRRIQTGRSGPGGGGQ